MIGNNTLQLNQATMRQALQEWLDKRMGNHAPQVTRVSPNHDLCETFDVETTDKVAVDLPPVPITVTVE